MSINQLFVSHAYIRYTNAVIEFCHMQEILIVITNSFNDVMMVNYMDNNLIINDLNNVQKVNRSLFQFNRQSLLRVLYYMANVTSVEMVVSGWLRSTFSTHYFTV